MLMRITSIFLRTSFKGVVSRNYTNGFKMLSIIFSFITFHSQYPRETIAYLHRPQTKLGEGNIFTHVCRFTGGGVVPYPLEPYPTLNWDVFNPTYS